MDVVGGIVIELDTTLTYPISVKFDDIIQIYTYTIDGRHDVMAEIPVLSFTEYEIVKNGFSQIRPQPEIAVDTLIFVRWSEEHLWNIRYFSHFDKKGNAVSFDCQLKSTETKNTTTWRIYENHYYENVPFINMKNECPNMKI